jgi:hypothetical protein
MTDSTSTLLAILFGLGVFAVIVAIGWRSVQNRRILRMQDASGHETIIVAREDDEVSSVVTTTETRQGAVESVPDVGVADSSAVDPVPAQEFGRKVVRAETADEVEADIAAQDRLRRVASSAK